MAVLCFGGIIQNICGIVIDFTQPNAAFHLNRIIGHKIIVGSEVVAGDGHLDAQFGFDGVRIIVLRDIGSKIGKKLAFVATGSFGKCGDNGIDLWR